MAEPAPIGLTQQAVFLFIWLLYGAAGLAVFRWLRPGLSAGCQGLLVFALAAQIAIVSLGLYLQPQTAQQRWLWHLDAERNVVSTLSTAQLALVGWLALFTAWVAAGGLARQRLLMIFVWLVFLFLAWDEWHSVKDNYANWQRYYAALGLALAGATAFIAWHAPREARKYYACILTGLGMSAVGAIILDIVPLDCDFFLLWRIDIDGCLDLYRIEEVLELVGVWIVLAAVCGLYCDARRGERARRLGFSHFLLPPLYVLGTVAVVPIANAFELRMTQPVDARYEKTVRLEAVGMTRDAEGYDVNLYVVANKWHRFTGLGYSLNLVDQASGEMLAQADAGAARRRSWHTALYDPTFKYVEWLRLRLPPNSPENRAMWLLFTVWREQDDGYERQRVVASDLPLLSDTQVILDEFVIRAPSQPASQPALAIFDNGFALQSVDMPTSVQSGETREIRFTWRAAEAPAEEYTQFLHFHHEATGAFWNFDQQPLGPRLPTRLWYSGLADSETWRVAFPADLEPGRYSVYTGLYALDGLARMSGRTADGDDLVDSRLPLGSIVVGS